MAPTTATPAKRTATEEWSDVGLYLLVAGTVGILAGLLGLELAGAPVNLIAGAVFGLPGLALAGLGMFHE